MSKNENNGVSPLEKLFAFLHLEEDEVDSLSYEEVEEEQRYMEMLAGLMAEGVGEGEDEEGATKLPDFVREIFADGEMLPALASFGSSHLLHCGALSGAAPGEEGVKEIPLCVFFGDSVLEKHLRWAEPTVTIVRESKGGEQARYVAFAEVRGAVGEGGRALRIVLTAPGGLSSEVTLNAKSPAGVFMGSELPADWSDIRPRLFLV